MATSRPRALESATATPATPRPEAKGAADAGAAADARVPQVTEAKTQRKEATRTHGLASVAQSVGTAARQVALSTKRAILAHPRGAAELAAGAGAMVLVPYVIRRYIQADKPVAAVPGSYVSAAELAAPLDEEEQRHAATQGDPLKAELRSLCLGYRGPPGSKTTASSDDSALLDGPGTGTGTRTQTRSQMLHAWAMGETRWPDECYWFGDALPMQLNMLHRAMAVAPDAFAEAVLSLAELARRARIVGLIKEARDKDPRLAAGARELMLQLQHPPQLLADLAAVGLQGPEVFWMPRQRCLERLEQRRLDIRRELRSALSAVGAPLEAQGTGFPPRERGPWADWASPDQVSSRERWAHADRLGHWDRFERFAPADSKSYDDAWTHGAGRRGSIERHGAYAQASAQAASVDEEAEHRGRTEYRGYRTEYRPAMERHHPFAESKAPFYAAVPDPVPHEHGDSATGGFGGALDSQAPGPDGAPRVLGQLERMHNDYTRGCAAVKDLQRQVMVLSSPDAAVPGVHETRHRILCEIRWSLAHLHGLRDHMMQLTGRFFKERADRHEQQRLLSQAQSVSAWALEAWRRGEQQAAAAAVAIKKLWTAMPRPPDMDLF